MIHDLHRIFIRYLWNFKEVDKNKDWVDWYDICRPKEEEGLSFRSMFDILKALYVKLW